MPSFSFLRLLAIPVLGAPLLAQVDSNTPGVTWPAGSMKPLADQDIRLSEDGRPAAWVNEKNAELRSESAIRARAADARSLSARIPLLRIDSDPVFGTPRWIASTARCLTAPVPGDAFDAVSVARAFVAAHPGLFEITPEELDFARRERDYLTVHNGTRHLTFQQEIGGVDLFGSELRANVSRHGELINVSSTMLPRPEGDFLLSPIVLTCLRAIRVAAASIGTRMTVDPTPQGAVEGRNRRQVWGPTSDFRADLSVTTELVYFPLTREDIRAAWKVFLPEIGVGNDYEILVDATDGRVLWRRNDLQFLVGGTQDLSLNVYTKDSPAPGSPGTATPNGFQFPTVSRSLLTITPASVPESPNSWINDGDNDTQGNNVDAHLDLNADNLPDLPRPTGVPFRVFDFFQDNAQAPTAWRDEATTNLFYFCNVYHDKLHSFGFDEASGNFQTDNFGLGGLGNDRVLADAQDGSGTNNANFGTPADGASGRMQQYIFTGPTPDRDSDVDSDIVYHEFSHGLSNRLHNLAVSGVQAGGMGEGWGDYFGVSLNAEATDDPNGVYSTGGYTVYLLAAGFVDNYYFGIRRFPYSTDLNKNPTTYADIDPAQQSYPPGIPRSPVIGNTANEVHNVGEVWCNMLLEVRAGLWATYGFAGNDRLMQLVVDGMKLDPGTPNFLQARDAILQADMTDYGGADLSDIWTAFAKRGCGYSATSPGGSTSNGVVEAFDLPILFVYPAGIPTQLQPNQPTTFPVEISGVGSLQPISGTGTQLVSVNGGAFNQTAMNETSPNHYDVTLPAGACFDNLRFYVRTDTTSGSAVNPTNAPASFYSATVFTGTSSTFDDDFQTDQGWTTSINGATTGAWERGVPVNDSGWAYDPASDADGSGQCYLTMNQPGNTDVDNGSVTLTSPNFDMTGGADLVYSYYLFLTDESGVDRMLVEINSNGGAGAWTAIATHTASGGNTWRQTTVTAAALSGLGVSFTSTMKVRFTANDSDPQSIDEAGVDGVHVQKILCEKSPGTSFCPGDGSGPACPCANNGNPGNGCNNSISTGGARLDATGTASPDTVVLSTTGEMPSALTLFVQGDATVSAANFGDGLRCVAGNLKRLYVKHASGGQASGPGLGDPSVTARSAALGDTIPPGATRFYFAYYRDPSPSFCPTPTGSTFNASNAFSIVW